MSLTFREYVAKARLTNTITGDLVRDLKADRTLRDFGSLDELKSYLRGCNACDEAMRVAAAVWRRYRHAAEKSPRLSPGA